MIKIIYLLLALNTVTANSVDVNPNLFEIYKQPYISIAARLIHIERLLPLELEGGPSSINYPIVIQIRPAQFITLWDCGEYGHVASKSERVYRFARLDSTLLLQNYMGKTIIRGIRPESNESPSEYRSSIFDDVEETREEEVAT